MMPPMRSGRQVGMQGLSPMVSLAFSAFRRPIHQGAMANQPLGGAMANQPLGPALESWWNTKTTSFQMFFCSHFFFWGGNKNSSIQMYNVVHTNIYTYIYWHKEINVRIKFFCFLRWVEQLSQDVLYVFGKGFYTSNLLPLLRNSWSFRRIFLVGMNCLHSVPMSSNVHISNLHCCDDWY